MKTCDSFKLSLNALAALAFLACWNTGALRAADPTFTLVKNVVASDAAQGDNFGYSVAASGDVVVVGAESADVFLGNDGAAYVFERNAGGPNNWGQVRKLTAPDHAPHFGSQVSVSGDIILVGHYNGNSSRGSAYVFERHRGGIDNWGQVKVLTASDGETSDGFGSSISVDGDTIVVGALRDAVGANQDQGSAYLFERNTGGADNWGQVKKLIASDGEASDFFGSSVSVSGDVVVVGAVVGDVGTNANQGSAYVFERNAGGANNWAQTRKLTASDGAADDLFGFSVAVSGDVIAVGAPATYVFARDTGGINNWGQTKKILLHGPVSVSGEMVLADRNLFQRDVGGNDNWGLAQSLTVGDGRTNSTSISLNGELLVLSGIETAYVFEMSRMAPSILQQPQARSSFVANKATFTVFAMGADPLSYQWYKEAAALLNGGPISGATSSNLVLTGVQLSDAGNYAVHVSNAFGSVTSSNATLTVLIAPAFVQQPLSQSEVMGGSVTFSAQFTGHPPPFTSEWRRLTAPLATNTFISDDTFSFFTLPAVQASAAADYSFVLKSASSPANGMSSGTFTLSVLADSDGDGLPDVWETTYPTAADPAMDTDNDGLTNLEEYRAGTDPTHAASVLRITGFTAGNPAALEFTAVSNMTYTVQHTDQLPAGSWSTLADIVARATNHTETITVPAPMIQRYYRLVTPRQP